MVPTKVCYQDEWFDLTPGVRNLPPIVQEGAYLLRAWLLGLNDGVADRYTVYLPEAMSQARGPSRSAKLQSFWAGDAAALRRPVLQIGAGQ